MCFDTDLEVLTRLASAKLIVELVSSVRELNSITGIAALIRIYDSGYMNCVENEDVSGADDPMSEADIATTAHRLYAIVNG